MTATAEKEATAPTSSHIANLATTQDVERIEAPVTWKAYLICAFASFGGIFFGYDSGYINGVLASQKFIDAVEYVGAKEVSESNSSLIVSILSCGTFFGALIAGDVADFIGRKWTVIIGCLIYIIGVVIQMITGLGDALGAIVAGRLIAGFGVGFESAIVILYMSEIVSAECGIFSFSGNPGVRATNVILLHSALARSVAPWSQATSSASPSASCLRPASSMPPRTGPTPAPTASRSPSSLSGP